MLNPGKKYYQAYDMEKGKTFGPIFEGTKGLRKCESFSKEKKGDFGGAVRIKDLWREGSWVKMVCGHRYAIKIEVFSEKEIEQVRKNFYR